MSSPDKEGEPVTVSPLPQPESKTELGLDSLTAAETAMAERKAAQSITTLGNENHPQAGLLGALGWVLFRRTDQRITYDAYMSSRTLTDITRELKLTADEDDDETDDEGKDEPPTSPS